MGWLTVAELGEQCGNGRGIFKELRREFRVAENTSACAVVDVPGHSQVPPSVMG